MPHIALNSAEPGIRGLLRYRPQTACPLSELTEVLLRGPSTLTRGERELIAAYVSALNDCRYCASSHAACAAAQLPGGMTLVEQVCADPSTAPVPAKLKALLRIAAAVRESGRAVTAEQVAEARAAGGQIRETWYNWGNGHWGGVDPHLRVGVHRRPTGGGHLRRPRTDLRRRQRRHQAELVRPQRRRHRQLGDNLISQSPAAVNKELAPVMA